MHAKFSHFVVILWKVKIWIVVLKIMSVLVLNIALNLNNPLPETATSGGYGIKLNHFELARKHVNHEISSEDAHVHMLLGCCPPRIIECLTHFHQFLDELIF